MRRGIWRIHAWLGLTCGALLLVIGLTGSLLVFDHQIDGLVAGDHVGVEPRERGRLPYDDLLRAAETALPGHEVVAWLPAVEPDRADVAYVVRRGDHEWRVAFVDPYRAQVRGGDDVWNETVTGWLLDFHYTLLADHAGMLITGVLGVLLCALGITGLVVYRKFWRHFFRLRWGQAGRILFADIHRAAGIGSVAFALLIGTTGAYLNLSHVIAEWTAEDHEEDVVITGPMYPEGLSVDGLLTRAAEAFPGFEANYVLLPWKPGAGVTLYGQAPDTHFLNSPYGSTVSLDPETGAITDIHDLREAGWWIRVVDTFEPLHFGDFGGWPIQILWCLAGLAPGVLSVTGSLVWWKRTRRRPRPAVSRPAKDVRPTPTRLPLETAR